VSDATLGFRSIARIDQTYYTVAHGDGDTEDGATALVDRGVGSADVAGPPVLRAAECDLGRRALRPLCRRAVRPVLCAGDGTAEPDAGSVLPPLADRVPRGHRLGTRHRLAGRRLAGGAEFPGPRARRRVARPFDDLAHATVDRCRDASHRLHVGPTAVGRREPVAREDGGDRRHDPGSECRDAQHRAARHGRKGTSRS
jgi:hypothetical protein